MNDAETAAATAQPIKLRPVIPSAFIHRETFEDIKDPNKTTGPSRPVDPPVERVITEAKLEANPAFPSTLPSYNAAPSMTWPTDLARPSFVKIFRIIPTINPPVIGIIITVNHGN